MAGEEEERPMFAGVLDRAAEHYNNKRKNQRRINL